LEILEPGKIKVKHELVDKKKGIIHFTEQGKPLGTIKASLN
jgi:hypothetical protein